MNIPTCGGNCHQGRKSCDCIQGRLPCDCQFDAWAANERGSIDPIAEDQAERNGWAPVQNVLMPAISAPLIWLGERLAESRVVPLFGGVAVGVAMLAGLAAFLPY